LALLTPAERAQLDQLLTAPRSIRDVVHAANFPVSVLRLMLDAIRTIKAESPQAKGTQLWLDLVRRLPAEIQGHVARALRDGCWQGPADPPLA
jgi:hypothetical protein